MQENSKLALPSMRLQGFHSFKYTFFVAEILVPGLTTTGPILKPSLQSTSYVSGFAVEHIKLDI